MVLRVAAGLTLLACFVQFVLSTPDLSSTAIPRAAFRRVSGWSAIGFATIIFLTNILILVPAGMPTTGAGEVIEFFGSNVVIVGLASVLLPTAWFLATMFGAGIVTAAGQPTGGRVEAWSLVGFAGLLLQNATFTAVTGVRLALSPNLILIDGHVAVGSSV